MQKFKQKTLILLSLGIFTPLALTTSKVNASSFGAEIFVPKIPSYKILDLVAAFSKNPKIMARIFSYCLSPSKYL